LQSTIKYNMPSQKFKIIIYAHSYKETLPLTNVNLSYEIPCFPYSMEVVE